MRNGDHKKNSIETRVLVLMPTGRDASLICRTLGAAGIQCCICRDVEELTAEIQKGAGAVLLAEEALTSDSLDLLSSAFDSQPVWSDLSVTLFAGNAQNAELLAATVGNRFNVTIVERPIRIPMLLSGVRGALRARQRQYDSRDFLRQLEESDYQKDLFLATLSHELRTPLNSILGWIQLLRSNDRSVNAERGLEVIERNAMAQAEIISDILFVSRIITGKLELEIEPVAIVPVIEQAIEVVRPSAELKKIKITTDFDVDGAIVDGNPERLTQIFWNILSNAVKFTPEGGEINVEVKFEAGKARIVITDNGQGIEPEFLPLIFERFRQADSSFTRKVGGLGLGLAIVRHLVELHNGEVSVFSAGLGHGTSFTVSLPLAETEVLPPVVEDDEVQRDVNAEHILKGVRILIVEDNEDSRDMLTVLFSQMNAEITGVPSVDQAIEELKERKYDVLISDIGMPDRDGYDLIRNIRSLPPEKGGSIPAIALTGYASLQDRELALEAGFQAHCSKPLDIEELINTLSEILQPSI